MRSISYVEGMDKFLSAHQVRDTNIGQFVEGISNTIKEHAREFAEKHRRPFITSNRVPPPRKTLRARTGERTFHSYTNRSQRLLRLSIKEVILSSKFLGDGEFLFDTDQRIELVETH